MPARPYFGWSEASKQRITTIFNDYLKATVIEGKDYP
jgi:phage gpG-like protein